MTVGLVMTVGYYRLLNWAYCENGLENQNTAPFLPVHDQFPPWRALQNSKFSTRIQSHLVIANCI